VPGERLERRNLFLTVVKNVRRCPNRVERRRNERCGRVLYPALVFAGRETRKAEAAKPLSPERVAEPGSRNFSCDNKKNIRNRVSLSAYFNIFGQSLFQHLLLGRKTQKTFNYLTPSPNLLESLHNESILHLSSYCRSFSGSHR